MSGLEGALCVGRAWLFDSTDERDHIVAAEICKRCPAIEACRELLAKTKADARYSGGPTGTWAGELTGTTRKVREHGNERGYQQHRWYKEPKCEACKQAHNAQLEDYFRTHERVELGADKRSPSRVLGRSATEASTDYEGVG